MLLLGLSAGLPFMLVGNTMGLWLREGGIELTAIGFLSWVGIMYSMKFLWAPIIDKTDVPVLGRLLGHRRGWMILAQLVVAAGLLGMAVLTPQGGLMAFAGLALVAAFASATQDIVIDAWRIETADNGEELSLLSSAYQLGYRAALLLTDAWILVLAAKIGWTASYELIAGLMGLGMIAVMFARESRSAPTATVVDIDPAQEKLGVSDAMVLRWLAALVVGLASVAYLVVAHNVWLKPWGWDDAAFAVGLPLVLWLLLRTSSGNGQPVREATWSRPLVRPLLRFFDGAIGPLLMFFRDHGTAALLILLAISLYRLPDFVMGPMNNPFYADIGITKEFVGEVRASLGLAASVLGIAAAGISAVRFGFVPTLLAGAILGPGSNAAFTWVAYSGGDAGVFMAAMCIDGFSTGFAGTALVAYMSSLTSIGYTATQYALLSSFYALLGKVLKGFSGVAVEQLQAVHGEIGGYALFFLGTAVTGVPALLLCVLLARRIRAPNDAPLAGGGPPG